MWFSRPALLEVIAGLDGMGRPLFSELRELPLPQTMQGQLWRAGELVREHRGDGHLAACVAAGLGTVQANAFTELWLGYSLGEYTSTRGFGTDRIAASLGSITDWNATSAHRADLRDLVGGQCVPARPSQTGRRVERPRFAASVVWRRVVTQRLSLKRGGL